MSIVNFSGKEIAKVNGLTVKFNNGATKKFMCQAHLINYIKGTGCMLK